MRTFAVYDAGSGVVTSWVDAEEPPVLPEGVSFLEVDLGTRPLGHVLKDGQLQAPAVPAIDLDALRRQQVTAAEAQLAGMLKRSCTTSIGVVQCDQEATDNIAAKVLSAMAAKMAGNASWRQAWRRTDNSWSGPMTSDQMIGFAQEVEAHVQACRLACWAAKDAIAAAADPAAVDITAGYPA